MRGTSDQLVLAQKLLSDIDKPKPEVVIDIVVMQIRRDKVRNMGINLPNSTTVAWCREAGLEQRVAAELSQSTRCVTSMPPTSRSPFRAQRYRRS